MRALRLAQFAALRLLWGEARWWGRATALAEGWRELRKQPGVIADLTTLGHIFEPDIDPATGKLYAHDELVARSARRSMALMLLARAEITHDELNLIRMETLNDTAEDIDDGRS